jgi:sugar lactone lactonase YvrE
VIRTHVAEIAVEEAAEHAEGPLWDARRRSLLWIDQYRGLVREARLVDGRLQQATTTDVGGAVGAVVPRAAGGWIVAAGTSIQILNEDGTRHPIVDDISPDDGVRRRWNDGKVDPLGRFWIGTMAYDRSPGAGSLYLLDHGRITTALDGVTISNGLAWNRAGDVLWYIDTPTGQVARFLVHGDVIERENQIVTINPAHGNPDGMTIDAEGCLWVALWGGSAVQRYSPDGELLERIEVAARQVSSCCFGGDDLGTLFITTSAEDYGPADRINDPHAGKIFAVRPGVIGFPADGYTS